MLAILKRLSAIERFATVKTYQPGQLIYEAGQKSYGFYYVKSGCIKVFNTCCQHQHDLILKLAGADKVIGYQSLIAQSAHSTTAEAIRESEVFFIEEQDFEYLLKFDQEFALKMLKISCAEQQTLQNLAMSMAYRTVRQRVAQVLLMLDREVVNKHNEKKPIRFKRIEISQLAGTARETSIRFLSEFAQDGLIAIEGRSIFIKDSERLRKIVGQ